MRSQNPLSGGCALLGALTLAICLVGASARAQVTARALASLPVSSGQVSPLASAGTDFTMLPSFHNANVANIPGGYKLGDSKLSLFVVCFNVATGAIIANCDVQLQWTVVPGSGGHLHYSNRPAGTFTPSSGNTGPSGFLPVVYTAPDASGVTNVTISGFVNGLPIIPGLSTIGVEIDGLQAIPIVGQGYIVTEHSDFHDDNNIYGTPAFNSQIETLPAAFQFALTIQCALGGACLSNQPVLRFGAMNLPQGGLFDFHATWSPPHNNHRVGWEADMEIQSSAGCGASGQFVPLQFRPALNLGLGLDSFIAPYSGENIDFPCANHWHIIGGH